MEPELAEKLAVQVLRTGHALVRASRRVFRRHGISEAQFNVLNILASPPGGAGLSQREISDILVVDRSNVTGLLDRMEAAGWVRREAVPGDRRAWRVRLTAAGRRLWQSCLPDYQRALTEVTAPLRATEARIALAVLTTLEDNAGVSPPGAPES